MKRIKVFLPFYAHILMNDHSSMKYSFKNVLKGISIFRTSSVWKNAPLWSMLQKIFFLKKVYTFAYIWKKKTFICEVHSTVFSEREICIAIFVLTVIEKKTLNIHFKFNALNTIFTLKVCWVSFWYVLIKNNHLWSMCYFLL